MNSKEFQPYIRPQSAVPELTLRAVILGTLLGVIFGASSLYLVLKVGLTVSASERARYGPRTPVPSWRAV